MTRAITRWDPIRDVERILQDVEQWVRSLGWDWETGTFGPTVGSTPAMDVYEKDDALIVEVDLPGLRKGDIQIRIDNGTLSITGERKGEARGDERVYCRERWFGRFTRTITLPDTVDPNAVTAQFKDGVLRITLPKKPEARPVEVKVH